jgi:hypothetical protein
MANHPDYDPDRYKEVDEMWREDNRSGKNGPEVKRDQEARDEAAARDHRTKEEKEKDLAERADPGF